MEPSMTAVPNELVNRVRQEFLEMPGLVLTCGQASRLWNLEIAVCEALLGVLVREGFLFRREGGAFLRRGSGGRRAPNNRPNHQSSRAEAVPDKLPADEPPVTENV